MKTTNKIITVFEHQTIKLNQQFGDGKFDEQSLKSLQMFYGEKGVPYFTLVHNGVRFNEFVGVIQVGETIIEVLPKADNTFSGINEKGKWRDILIDMIWAVGIFDIHAPSSSSLKLKHNSILDLYFELFINEVEYLLHSGLIKKYRKREGNVTALKGSLHFGKHIQKNLIHQDRFYVKHTIYDVEHTLHFILYKTIRLLKQINTNSELHGRIGALLLNFPEMHDIKVSETTFDKLKFNRKSQPYKKAIDIAKLLILQYHPDVSNGNNSVLALMFDMNLLWEQFVFASLKKHKQNFISINAQTSKIFWKPEHGNRSKMRPDIVINLGNNDCVVLDTKWKNLNGYNPSPEDLRQMYVYHEYFSANKVALVYPGLNTSKSNGRYINPKPNVFVEFDKECSVISLAVEENVKKWQKNICTDFENWFK